MQNGFEYITEYLISKVNTYAHVEYTLNQHIHRHTDIRMKNTFNHLYSAFNDLITFFSE